MPPKKRKADTPPIPKQKQAKKEASDRVEWHEHEDWTTWLLQLLLDKPCIYAGLFGGTEAHKRDK